MIKTDDFSLKSQLQAFTDMQVNKIETTKKLKMLEMQAEMLKTSKKKYDITDKEISSLANDTRYGPHKFIAATDYYYCY